jgi:hypothetical protein
VGCRWNRTDDAINFQIPQLDHDVQLLLTVRLIILTIILFFQFYFSFINGLPAFGLAQSVLSSKKVDQYIKHKLHLNSFIRLFACIFLGLSFKYAHLFNTQISATIRITTGRSFTYRCYFRAVFYWSNLSSLYEFIVWVYCNVFDLVTSHYWR